MSKRNYVPAAFLVVASILTILPVFMFHIIELQSDNSVFGVDVPLSLKVSPVDVSVTIRAHKQSISLRKLQPQKEFEKFRDSKAVKGVLEDIRDALRKTKNTLKGYLASDELKKRSKSALEETVQKQTLGDAYDELEPWLTEDQKQELKNSMIKHCVNKGCTAEDSWREQTMEREESEEILKDWIEKQNVQNAYDELAKTMQKKFDEVEIPDDVNKEMDKVDLSELSDHTWFLELPGYGFLGLGGAFFIWSLAYLCHGCKMKQRPCLTCFSATFAILFALIFLALGVGCQLATSSTEPFDLTVYKDTFDEKIRTEWNRVSEIIDNSVVSDDRKIPKEALDGLKNDVKSTLHKELLENTKIDPKMSLGFTAYLFFAIFVALLGHALSACCMKPISEMGSARGEKTLRSPKFVRSEHDNAKRESIFDVNEFGHVVVDDEFPVEGGPLEIQVEGYDSENQFVVKSENEEKDSTDSTVVDIEGKSAKTSD